MIQRTDAEGNYFEHVFRRNFSFHAMIALNSGSKTRYPGAAGLRNLYSVMQAKTKQTELIED